MLCAGLRCYQPVLPQAEVTSLMQKATVPEMQALLQAFGYAVTPDPEDAKELNLGSDGEADPTTAQTVTTGEDSTSALVAPV